MDALDKANYNISKAAKILYITRTTLYSWIKRYNINLS